MNWQKTDFRQKKTHQIRDCLIIGLKSKELSEKLQLWEDLSLEKAVEIARSYEQVKTQMEEMQDNSVDAVKGKKKYPKKAAIMLRCKKCYKYHKFDNYPAKKKKKKIAESVIKWITSQYVADTEYSRNKETANREIFPWVYMQEWISREKKRERFGM